MNEKDMAHLRFLTQRARKGDVLTPEDQDFVMKIENEIQACQNNICEILAAGRELERNC